MGIRVTFQSEELRTNLDSANKKLAKQFWLSDLCDSEITIDQYIELVIKLNQTKTNGILSKNN